MTEKDNEEIENLGSDNYELFANDIKKKFGNEVLKPAWEIDNPEPNFTGSFGLDINLGVPIPEGRIIEIYGAEGSGKTSLCLEILGVAQKKGKRVAYLNAERNLNKSLLDSIRTLNVNSVDEDKNPTFIMLGEYSGENNLDLVVKFVTQFYKALIVVDSVDALVPEAILNGGVGEQTMGKHAKLMSDACRKLAFIAAKNKTTVVFINQVREKMTLYGDPTTTPGGRGLRFYSSQRIELKSVTKADQIQDPETEKIIGHSIRYKIIKNKLYPPYLEGKIPLIYGKGIWREMELVTLLTDLGLTEIGGKGGKQIKFSEEIGFLKTKDAAQLLEADPVLFEQQKNILLKNFFPHEIKDVK